MNDNYLWDRSGEVDAEIQELEKVLGTLRYQPRPLEIPANVQVGRRRRTFYPVLAIAAAIALIALGLSLWLNFNRRSGQEQAAKPKTENGQQTTIARQSQNDSNNAVTQVSQKENPTAPMNRETSARKFVAVRKFRRTAIEPELTPEEIAEKEQVLTALRLVSVKLNVAQRRTQSPPLPNLIRNQHKIG